jgi:hypothetical protein
MANAAPLGRALGVRGFGPQRNERPTTRLRPSAPPQGRMCQVQHAPCERAPLTSPLSVTRALLIWRVLAVRSTGEEALARISKTFESSSVQRTIQAQLAILAAAYISTINTLRKGGDKYALMLEPA